MAKRGQYQNRNRQRNQMIAAAIGFGISAIFIISLVAPTSFTSDPSATVTPNNDDFVFRTPTPTPRATPTVEPSGSIVAMGEPYINQTGLFQIPQPLDQVGLWTNPNPQNNPNPNTTTANLPASSTNADEIANTIFISPTRLALYHATTQDASRYANVLELQAALTEAYFDGIWSQYDSWVLSSTDTTQDNLLIYNFVLEDSSPDLITYLARYLLWFDNGLLSGLRIVVPANNADLLDHLQTRILPQFVSYAHLLDSPYTNTAQWAAKSDTEIGYLIKLPLAWNITEGGVGRARTAYAPFNTPSDVLPIRIVVQTRGQQPLASLDEAKTWLQNNITVPITFTNEGEAITQPFANGYLLEYTYENIDSDPFSSAIVLLNDAEGNLYTAELTTQGTVNFSEVTPSTVQEQAYEGLKTFTLLAPRDYVVVPEPFPASFITRLRHIPSSGPRTTFDNLMPGIFDSSLERSYPPQQ